MNFKEKIDRDLKAAMLSGDKDKVSVLRAIKSAILYAEVANGSRDTGGLLDADIQTILGKEAKKRQESADLYVKGGSQDKADAELSEKKIIEEYLPAQLSESEIAALVDAFAAENGGSITKEMMGAAIGAVKQKSGGAADGAAVARLVREKIASGGENSGGNS